MLNEKDLQAIDKLLQRRIKESEARLNKKILKNTNMLIKIMNFLDRELMSLTKRVKKLEDNSSFA
ncbi:hypothetical protein A2803_03095 [Candidatus Woesebacteria bacterium RIFCSPHIGHO2_01_FULL_44_21]|uniref:Uncharacterized protein n=1 Tax=Candidatus Woesebacteria bacterium RIFCSPHIGHO2_01_FULL_44_21 TaxID=1802503 RepID=A0A1F7Z1U2_9BACT|nr:MAG: hypothetical protein A2803_03095 [Candidatus Woesebacteria bacterium RIFCSPHIGHO2_01_FULL_44_21]OGM69198.1 MAG: hypothetical protein A2897_04285 [Candidatus Woesebacteria bacterium RIFCSPLOWO2_01_FULL_44_24b]